MVSAKMKVKVETAKVVSPKVISQPFLLSSCQNCVPVPVRIQNIEQIEYMYNTLVAQKMSTQIFSYFSTVQNHGDSILSQIQSAAST